MKRRRVRRDHLEVAGMSGAAGTGGKAIALPRNAKPRRPIDAEEARPGNAKEADTPAAPEAASPVCYLSEFPDW